MVTELSKNNSLVSEWMREIRDKNVQTDRMRFRRNIERIGEIAAYEISKLFDYQAGSVKTPLGEASIQQMTVQPVLATILRAGLPLHQGLLNYFDKADNAFVAAYRKHDKEGNFEIEQHYVASPELDGRPLVIADPMLATGASLALALQTLTADARPTQIHVVCVIASEEGILHLQDKFPEAHIWVGAIDAELTNHKYIVPGLGDAGDLAFGSKKQS